MALGGGERMVFNVAQSLSAQGHAVDICYLEPTDTARIQQRLNLSLDGIRLLQFPNTLKAIQSATQLYDLFINMGHRPFVQPQSKRSALVCFFPVGVDLSARGRWRWRVGNALRPFQSLLPKSVSARLNALPSQAEITALQSYQTILSITHYTQRWVQHYWQRKSDLLYPLVEPMQALPKENYIISVGRFRAGHNNKKHEVLTQAFRELVDAGLQGWQLHLIGGLTDEPEHQRYFAELQALARQYPIHLHPNLPHAQLSKRAGQAKIYWHATGYGEDLARFPDRAEHFGISTVEAMSAGCVPVVIDAGGQPEIVQNGNSGLLWRTLSELKTKTLQLIQQPEAWSHMSQQAQQRSALFCDQEAFRKSVLATLCV